MLCHRDLCQFIMRVLPADIDDVLKRCIQQELSAGNSVSSTSKQLAKQLKLPRSKVYKMALQLAGQQ